MRKMRMMSRRRRPDPAQLRLSEGACLVLLLATWSGLALAGPGPAWMAGRRPRNSTPAEASSRVGPPSGSLVIVGGAMKNPLILSRFMELAGGSQAAIVVIPTAQEGDLTPLLDSFADIFRKAGARQVTVLHTRSPEEADTHAFAAPLESATGVWFTGGRQWRLVDAYAGTRTESACHDLLARNGVIGGSSAGATIQGSYLVRGAPSGNTIMMSPGHEKGFGFLRGVAIDQHVIARHRQNDLIPVIEAHPDLLGFGIDEDTALVVHGDVAEVIGSSQVLVYDHARYSGTAAGNRSHGSRHVPVRSPDGQPAQMAYPRKDLPGSPLATFTGEHDGADHVYFALHPGDRFDLARRRLLPGS